LLETGARGFSAPAVAVILERSQRVSPFLSLLAEQFQLTCRESESMELLCKGLSTKEIAAEMKISPNTAKAFLHLVMLKMGVQGRSGILGAILQRQFTQLGAPPAKVNGPERIRRAS
jgi:DNA-binding CsgD family transcriptional regulator